MIENIKEFDGAIYENLWGGFTCDIKFYKGKPRVCFYKKNDLYIIRSGAEAEDLLDFVLSEYYENDDTKIEDGFNTWLMGYYDDIPPVEFDENDWQRNKEQIKKLKEEISIIQDEKNKQIKRLREEIKRLKSYSN